MALDRWYSWSSTALYFRYMIIPKIIANECITTWAIISSISNSSILGRPNLKATTQTVGAKSKAMLISGERSAMMWPPKSKV